MICGGAARARRRSGRQVYGYRMAANPCMLAAARENAMTSQKGPNIKKKQKCKNCEGKGLLKKGDKVVKCQRCGGTGLR